VQAFDASWIGTRTDDDEVVVRHEPAIHARTGLHELLLGFRRVHQEHVGLAPLPHPERLPGPDGHGLHPVAGLLLEAGDQLIEQARVLGTGRGGENHVSWPVAADR